MGSARTQGRESGALLFGPPHGIELGIRGYVVGGECAVFSVAHLDDVAVLLGHLDSDKQVIQSREFHSAIGKIRSRQHAPSFRFGQGWSHAASQRPSRDNLVVQVYMEFNNCYGKARGHDV